MPAVPPVGASQRLAVVVPPAASPAAAAVSQTPGGDGDDTPIRMVSAAGGPPLCEPSTAAAAPPSAAGTSAAPPPSILPPPELLSEAAQVHKARMKQRRVWNLKRKFSEVSGQYEGALCEGRSLIRWRTQPRAHAAAGTELTEADQQVCVIVGPTC